MPSEFVRICWILNLQKVLNSKNSENIYGDCILQHEEFIEVMKLKISMESKEPVKSGDSMDFIDYIQGRQRVKSDI